jgi:rare lipoprotein A
MNLTRQCLALVLPLLMLQPGPGDAREPARHEASTKQGKASAADRSGKTRKGKASYYGSEFYGKKMASGKPMNPRSNVAASKTLPLGTKAKVTNLATGKSETVVIEDRGPYVKGRVIDVSPKTADKLGMKKDGVAPVEVKPLTIPKADNGTKPDQKEAPK